MPENAIKFGILIYGSNGDIELMVSLSQELARRGHEINLFIISINRRDYSFLNAIEGINVSQHLFPEQLLGSEDVEFWSKSLQDLSDLMERRYQLVAAEVVKKAYEYAPQCDVLVGPTYMLEVPCIAEKFNKRYISLRPFSGLVRSAHEAPFFLPSELFPGLSNLELWDVCDAYTNRASKRRLNKFRREHGLNPVNSISRDLIESPWLNLIAYSNYLYPAKPDWSSTYHQCGFFKSPSYINWDVPESLLNFIQGDEKPVFITIGTMMEYESDREGFKARLLGLAHSINRKVIIHADWPEESIDKNVYLLRGFISYDKLIPLCALAVHHGGVGTAHIMTELACPSIIISYGFEQPFNCRVLEMQGVSGGSILRKEFCEEKLKALIDKALDNSELKLNAEKIALQLRGENGLANAANIIEAAYHAS